MVVAARPGDTSGMISPFIGAYYNDSTRGFDSQRCINFTPFVSQSGTSKSKLHLVGDSGSKNKGTITTNNGTGCRGLYETAGGRLFGTWGNTLIEINSNETPIDRNTSLRFVRIGGSVSMADNGTQLMIVDDGKGYIYTFASDTIVEITDPDFPANANQVVFNDGYFLVSVPGTKRFYISALNNGLSWNALGFASITSAPDNIIGLISANTDVWMFGEKSIEVWEDTGVDATVPYERREGATQNIGTKNPFTIQKMNGQVYFLGSNNDGYGVVWRTNGYNLEQISTDVINQKINEVGSSTNATAYTYQEKGHYHYVITIPSINITFSFDASTGLWHEKAFWNITSGAYDRHRSTYQTFAFGKNYIGFNGNNILYEIDPDHYFDDTDLIRRVRSGSHLHAENKNIRYNKFEIEFERGQGLTVGQGSEPQIMLNYSNDGGFEFTTEDWVGAGKIGEYDKRARWHELGTARDRVFQIAVTDPIKWDIIDAYMDIEVLKS